MINRLIVIGLGGTVALQSFERPLDTASQPRSPIIIHGFVQAITKRDAEGHIFNSYEIKEDISNISQKDILLWVVKLQFTAAAGSTETKINSRDYFFQPKLLAPNARTSFEDSGLPYGMTRVEPIPMPPATKALAAVAFVQFSNGETWGNVQDAKEVLRSRLVACKRLQQLRESYEKYGTNRFTEELKLVSDMPLVNAVYFAYRDGNEDVSAAVQKLNQMLEAAAAHKITTKN